jgi:hypothetical protein
VFLQFFNQLFSQHFQKQYPRNVAPCPGFGAPPLPVRLAFFPRKCPNRSFAEIPLPFRAALRIDFKFDLRHLHILKAVSHRGKSCATQHKTYEQGRQAHRLPLTSSPPSALHPVFVASVAVVKEQRRFLNSVLKIQ